MNTRKRLTIPAMVAVVMLTWLSGLVSTAGETRRDQSAVIGKTFRISDAVSAYCAMKPVVMMCEAFAPQLAEFLAEPRDAEWAAPVERLIAKSMLVDGRRWAEIRALECRRTRCALEYAVSTEDLGRNVDGDAELDRLMEPIGGVMAPELTSGSAKGGMWVSVLIWRKRA
jgi:hypothetical protein